MGNLITVDEQEFERRVRRIVRSEMAAGLRIVHRASSDLDDDDGGDSDDDDDVSGVVRRKKKRRAKKKKKRAASAGGKKKRSGKKKAKRRARSAGLVDQIHTILMAQGALRVTQLQEITGISQSTLNRHLNTLVDQRRAARLNDGIKVLYKATHDGRIGRKTAEKTNGAKRSDSVPPPSSAKPVAA